MKNPLAILFILFGVGALLVLAEILLVLPARAAIIPIIIAVAISLGCLGSGIVLVIADIKYKLPPKNGEDRYQDHYRDRY